ncbi:MAG TPA: hypothetical protein VM674_05490 [Candidatus Acidoferrum sp.]|nr:hypothetical protein [Candidatus Acidoferrum sp.]
MTVGTSAIAAQPAAPSRLIAGSAGFNWAFIVLATWPVSGAYLDSWAHRHVPSLETFFTPWHAVLYSGVAACLLFLGTVLLWNQAHGASWQRALPAGYGLSLIGLVLFGIGGVLDLGWHTLFGIERNVSALLSPTHLVLMASMALIVTGPLRAVGLTSAVRATWPAVVSATLLLSGFTFFTQFNNPLINQWATNPRAFSEQEGVAGVIIYAGLMSAVVLLLVHRFLLPLGAITLMFTLNALFVTGLVGFDRIIVLCALNGLVADLALVLLRTALPPARAFRIFAAFVPGFFFLTYFLALNLVDVVWWPIHVWTGCIVIAGIVGWLLSLAMVPPASLRLVNGDVLWHGDPRLR